MENQPTDLNLYNSIKAKIKARVSKWPSAYASGQLVKEYSDAMIKQGKQPYTSKKKGNLHRWYQEDWIDIKTNKPCGSVKMNGYYPTCRPSIRVSSKTPVTANELSQKEKAIATKQQVKGTKNIKFV
jgi:hypothetical protein